jgi:hypothetical protein
MPFFLTTIAASGISSSSPNDNSPVFLLCQLATKMNARLFRSCPPLPDLHFFFRFDPRLSLRPPLFGGLARSACRRGFKHLPFGTFLLVNVELTDI